MEAIARTKYLKGSPRKARLVIDLVRGKNVSQALAILKFTNKRAANPIAKCIRSAVANATYSAEQRNIAIDPDDLWIKTCHVDMGPTKNRRRLRPAPQGRAHQERRHYCHITIKLSSDNPEDKKEGAKQKNRDKKLEKARRDDAEKEITEKTDDSKDTKTKNEKEFAGGKVAETRKAKAKVGEEKEKVFKHKEEQDIKTAEVKPKQPERNTEK